MCVAFRSVCDLPHYIGRHLHYKRDYLLLHFMIVFSYYSLYYTTETTCRRKISLYYELYYTALCSTCSLCVTYVEIYYSSVESVSAILPFHWPSFYNIDILILLARRAVVYRSIDNRYVRCPSRWVCIECDRCGFIREDRRLIEKDIESALCKATSLSTFSSTWSNRSRLLFFWPFDVVVIIR